MTGLYCTDCTVLYTAHCTDTVRYTVLLYPAQCTVQYSTVQYSTVTVQYSAQYSAQYSQCTVCAVHLTGQLTWHV
jgi:hypothetical protein